MAELGPNEVLKTLVDTAAPYWGAERETVVRFLKEPVTADEHVATLGFLCHKEAWGSGLAKDENGLIGGPIFRSYDLSKENASSLLLNSLLLKLSTDFSSLGQICSLENYQEDLNKATYIAQRFESQESLITPELEAARDEYSHFRLFASIARDFFDQNFSPLNVKDFQSDWDLTLQHLRDDVKSEHGDLGAAASKFTEGGGGAIFDGMMEFIGNEFSEYQNRWAELGHLVLLEEIDHMQIGVQQVSELIKTDHQLETVTNVIEDISRVRVRMRNEIFGNPLEKTEILYLGMPDSSIKPFIPGPVLRLIS